jgi:hypothetical protein
VSTRLLAVAVCALLGWSAWARGGTVVALQGPLPWMGLAILVLLALDRLLPSGSPSTANGPLSTVHGSLSSPLPTSDLRPLTSDRFLFWSGLAFLALLSVQWWNAGRYPYFHPFDQRWAFTPAPHPGWPWAVDRSDAAEMLRWFFPAWALMLALRHARRPAWLATRVAWFLVINAGLLAAFGIAQALSGTQRIFWITPMADHFFASFGYENHAASYFALLFALSAGMLLQRLKAGQRSEVGDQRPERNCSLSTVHCSLPTAHLPPPTSHLSSPPPTTYHLPPAPAPRPSSRLWRTSVATASICAVLCLIGMALSFSRAGLALALGFSGVTLFAAVRLFWPRVSIAQRVTVVAATVMGAATVFFVVASMGGAGLAHEASRVTTDLGERVFMMHSALQRWAEPWFGVGGWGYSHFVPLYAMADPGRLVGPGYANTHNDALQFLCEFGAGGFGLMLAAALGFAWPTLRCIRRRFTPGLALLGAGLLAVLCHSLIDLPFRSPGILYAWLAVCGGGEWVGEGRGAERQQAVDHGRF